MRMCSANPFAEFRYQCEKALASAAQLAFPQCSIQPFSLSKPSNFDHGHLASSICFGLAKELKQKPSDLSAKLVSAIEKSQFNLNSKIEAAGG
jgi:arginyl-tRNA synthetase